MPCQQAVWKRVFSPKAFIPGHLLSLERRTECLLVFLMALTSAIDNHTFRKSCAGHHAKGITGCLYILDKSFLDRF